MAENYEVFKTDIDVAIKNAKETLKDLKAIQAGLKDMGGYSVDLSKNFKNLQTTLKQFSARNVALFGKDFGKYIGDTSSKFEKLDATIDSLFKKLPKKAEPAVILLRKRFQELRAEIASTEDILASLEKHSITIKQLEKAKSTPGLSSEAIAGMDVQLTKAKEAHQAIVDKLKEEGREIKDVEDLYQRQLKSLGAIGVHVKAVGEGQARAAASQREYNEQLRQSVAEQEKLVKATEKQAVTDEKIAVHQKRFAELQAARTNVPAGGVVGLVSSYKKMFAEISSIEPSTTGLKGFLDTSKQIFGIWQTAYTTGGFGKSVKDITYGVDLINTKGTNTFNALKLAIYGAGDPTDRLGKLLVKAAAGLEDFKQAQYSVNKQSAYYIEVVNESVNRTRKQGTALKEQATAAGIAGTAFSALNGKISESNKMLERVQSLMMKGASPEQTGLLGTTYVKAVRTLELEFKELEQELVTVHKLSNDPKSMHPLISQLRQMATVTKETEQAMNQASDALLLMAKGSTVVPFLDKLKGKFFNLLDPFKHMKTEAQMVGKNVHALTGDFDEPVKKAHLLGSTIAGATKQATIFGEAMKGAIIGSFLGPIFSEALQAVGKLFSILLTPVTLPFQALLAPFKLLSSILDTLTSQITQFFAALPQKFFQSNKLMQDFNTTLTQMMSGFDKATIAKNLKGANEFIKSIIAKTPFELPTGQAAYQQLLTAGFDPKKWLEPAADAAAAMNKDMHQLIFAMQRLKSGEKGMGVSMLRDFGIMVKEVGVWTDATGKAIDKQELFQDGVKQTNEQLVQSGYVWKKWSFDTAGSLKQQPIEALEIFNGYLKQNAVYAGASAARSRTLTGILSNLNDAVTTILTSFGAPIFQAFTDVLSDIYDTIQHVITAIEPFTTIIGTELAGAITTAWTNLTGITQGLNDFGEKSEGALAQIKTIAGYILEILKPAFMVLIAVVKGDFPKAWGLFLKAAQDVLRKIGEWLKGSGKEWLTWGIGLVKNIATGLITGAKTFIKSAVTVIANMIGSFLKPGSPPREGPLKTIHTWGKGLIDTFSQGFKLADMSFLTGITETIKGALSNLGIDQFKSIRKNVIAIIGGINQTGQINEELWASIQKQIGNGNAELSQFVRLTLELKQVTKEYQDAEKAGFIPKELQDRMEAAQLAVALKEEELKLQEQVNQASSSATGAGGQAEAPVDLKKQLADELELLKKRKKVGLITEKEYLEGVTQLRRQYAEQYLVMGDEGAAKDQIKLAAQTDKKIFEQDKEFLEKKKKLGLVTEAEYLSELQSLNKQEAERLLLAGDEGAARQKIEEAKSLQKAIDKAALTEQKIALEKQIKQEQDILKIKFEKGMITEQEYRQGLVKIQEGYIDQLLSLGYPIDKELDKLKSLKEELKKFEPPAISVQDTLMEAGKDVTDELSNMMDGIMAEFNTLGTSTWEEFSKTFHTAFDGVWGDISTSIFGEGTGTGMGDIKKNLLAWIGTLWTDLTAEGGALSDMTSFFNTISAGFTTWSEGEGKTKVSEIGVIIGNALVEGIKLAVYVSGDSTVQSFVTSMVTAGGSIITGFLDLGRKSLAGFIQGIFEAIGDGSKMDELGKMIVDQLSGGIITALTTVVFPLGGLYIQLKKPFDDLYTYLVGESLIPEMMDEIVNLFIGLPERIMESDLITGITNLFPTFEDMQALGTQMMEGLIQGWNDMSEGLHTAFDALVPQWIQDRLPINSPAVAGPLSVPINWNYLSEGLPEAMAVLNTTLTAGITSVATTTQTTMFNMKNAVTEGVTTSVETVKKSMFDMKNAVETTVKDIDKAISSSSSSGGGLGSGFGSYGQNSGSGPSIGAQGGIAASWRRFFALLRGGGNVDSHQAGSAYVTHTGKALIHKGEMILPAQMADAVRSQLSSANTNVSSNINQGRNYNFEAGAFAGAFPNVSKAKDAVDIMKQIEQMVGKSEMRASVV